MIRVDDFNFTYKDSKTLSNLSLRAKAGEITVLIGPNGSGKSTLLKSVAGLLRGTGSIFVHDKEVQSLRIRERARLIGYLSQDMSCEAALNVFEIVLLGMVGGLGLKATKDDINQTHLALQSFGLGGLAKRNISELSGGQRQMVFIAQALVKQPKILIFDEPTSNLDLCRQYELMDRLRDLTQSRQLTTLLTLHHLELVAHYADCLVVLNDGEVYGSGAVHSIMNEQMFLDVFRLRTEIFTDKRGTLRVLPIAPV